MEGQGSVASLYATAPQDEYLLDPKYKWNKERVQHSKFSIDQSRYQFGNGPYFGTTQTFEITPKSIPGDLLCNAYLRCKLPDIFANTYTDQVGRAIIKTVSFYLSETEIETINDDWYIIRDQLFLSADEKNLMSNLINGNQKNLTTGYSGGTIDLYIPLDFFFCRNFSTSRLDKKKPMFPLCAVWNQRIYIKIEFANLSQFSTCNNGSFDFVDTPEIVFEHIMLEDQEREFYKNGYDMSINKLYKEPVSDVDNIITNISLTAKFPVSLLVWFIKKKISSNDPLTYNKRFDYSYITTNNLSLADVDIFEYLNIYINNEDITDKLPGKKFYKYLQPLYAGLSSPTKDIYMYSFGLQPNQYNQGGSVDFSKVDSNTSFLSFKIKNQFVSDISVNYTLNLYYYGYSLLKFSDGYCTKVYD